ncbi:hypothetical protein [Microseira sp. BLCC-F43]|jgi:hypothetical protein|uniref:hypothetical protein n=1 Tax=Microseira sp. BLCC-F43 TaxID=3153602 RepID=UPI0035BB045E
MVQDFQILKRIYHAFDPFRPLPAGDPTYVDCREVRGDGDILVKKGREILPERRNMPVDGKKYKEAIASYNLNNTHFG